MNVILLNNRQVKMLKAILQAHGDISLQDVVEKCRIQNCAKTVRSDFTRIQDFAAGFQVTLSLQRGVIRTAAQENDLRHLEQATVELYNSTSIAYTDDRVSHIVLDCLLSHPIPSLDVWSERFNISRPCIQRDMKSVRQWLEKEGLTLRSSPGRGYQLSGGEYRLRKALVVWALEQYGNDVISFVTQKSSDAHQSAIWYRLFGDADVLQLFRVLAEFSIQSDLDEQNVQYTMLALYVAIMLRRACCGLPVTIDELPANQDFFFSVSILRLSAVLEQQLHISISPVELMSLQTFYQELSHSLTPQPGEKNVLMEAGRTIVEELACEVELMLGLPLSSNAKSYDEFFEFIMQILCDQKLSASSLSKMEISSFAATYPAEYALGQRLLPLGRQLLGIELPAAAAVEVGVFIALRMEQQISAQKEKKNVLLIAPGNIHLSLLSYWQMVNRLGSLLNRIEVCSYQAVIASPLPKDVDFVISTVELPNLGQKNIVIPRMLSESDILHLRRRLLGEVCPEQTGALGGALKTIAFYDAQSHTSDELFDWIGAQLEQEGYAQKGYRAGLRAHEKIFGSGIETPKPLAIPHTGADLTRTPVLAIVVTRHPIPIKLIASSRTTPTNLFLFPLLEQESAEIGLAFYSVISRLRNKKLAAALCACKSREDILRFAAQNL